MPYRPKELDQPNSLTCVDTSTALLVDRITLGRIRPYPLVIRRATGVSGRGISYMEAADAVKSLYGITLLARYGLSRSQVVDLEQAGRAHVQSIYTGVTRYTTRRTGTFVGPHSIYCNDEDWNTRGESCRCELSTGVDHREMLFEDPGTFTLGFMWWSASLAFKASEARTGGNGTNVLYGRDTEGVKRLARIDHYVYADADPQSTKRGVIHKGDTIWCASTLNGAAWNGSTPRNGWARGTNLRTGKAGFIQGKVLA